MGRITGFLAKNWTRIVSFLLVAILMVCSFTILGKTFTDPQTYIGTIKSIDQKKMTVLGVSAAIAGSSTLLAAIPDDATTPLANKLMDLCSYLLIVVCVLVLEKSLLTVFGAVSCYVLFPVACLFGLIYIVKQNKTLLSWAIKLAILALAVLTIVPASMKISDYIYEVNQVVIEQKEEIPSETVTPEAEVEQQEDTRNWWEKLRDSITNAAEKVVDTVTNTAQDAIEKGKAALNDFTDAVAVFVIAYCAIPVFVVFLFLWLLKILFGINIEAKGLKPNFKKAKQLDEQKEKSLVAVE